MWNLAAENIFKDTLNFQFDKGWKNFQIPMVENKQRRLKEIDISSRCIWNCSSVSPYRFILMRDTSCTVRAHSSTSASLWSTSLRSVSEYPTKSQTTRKKTGTRMKVRHAALISQILQHNMQQKLSYPIKQTHLSCCPIRFELHSVVQHLHVQRGLKGLHPLSSPVFSLCWLLVRRMK